MPASIDPKHLPLEIRREYRGAKITYCSVRLPERGERDQSPIYWVTNGNSETYVWQLTTERPRKWVGEKIS